MKRIVFLLSVCFVFWTTETGFAAGGVAPELSGIPGEGDETIFKGDLEYKLDFSLTNTVATGFSVSTDISPAVSVEKAVTYDNMNFTIIIAEDKKPLPDEFTVNLSVENDGSEVYERLVKEGETGSKEKGTPVYYFKGTEEPTPEAGTGNPTAGWAQPGFDPEASGWTEARPALYP